MDSIIEQLYENNIGCTDGLYEIRSFANRKHLSECECAMLEEIVVLAQREAFATGMSVVFRLEAEALNSAK